MMTSEKINATLNAVEAWAEDGGPTPNKADVWEVMSLMADACAGMDVPSPLDVAPAPSAPNVFPFLTLDGVKAELKEQRQ